MAVHDGGRREWGHSISFATAGVAVGSRDGTHAVLEGNGTLLDDSQGQRALTEGRLADGGQVHAYLFCTPVCIILRFITHLFNFFGLLFRRVPYGHRLVEVGQPASHLYLVRTGVLKAPADTDLSLSTVCERSICLFGTD